MIWPCQGEGTPAVGLAGNAGRPLVLSTAPIRHGPVPAGLCCADFRGMQPSRMAFSQRAWLGACGDSSEIPHTGADHSPSCRLLVKPPVSCGSSTLGSQGSFGGLGHRVSASPRAWAGAASAQPPLRGADVMEERGRTAVRLCLFTSFWRCTSVARCAVWV